MSGSVSSQIKHLRSLIPLWKQRIPPYPLYQKGNPQLRIFLPQFWMKMVKPSKELPSDRVWFIVHPQMSKMDVKNYLEKIYNVPVLQVKTDIRPGEEIKHPLRGYTLTFEDDYKLAFVQLGKGQTFKFPDIFEGVKSESEKHMEDLQKNQQLIKESEAKDWDKLSIPPWFR